ncbi:MAG: hypothetical protein LUE12_03420 [Ruminococcus sp.]|nr:hypothetical protein [Ruminococcus sp.]MCD8095162.1 hypothetical protein [Ruminococcus sp.]
MTQRHHFNLDDVKLEALACYLLEDIDASASIQALAETTAEKELEKMYVRYVPKVVREFLLKKGEKSEQG